MSPKRSTPPPPSGGASGVVSESRTPLRDNLESIALAILMVLVVRQLVVEAFKIPTGSMAPTLLGVHKEVRCPNCGWTFRMGHDKVGEISEDECPNCHYRWPGTSSFYPGEYRGEEINFRWPAWLWNSGTTAVTGHTVDGLEAANRVDRWGSRIFVNKFIYKLRPPKRWEVVVFRFPYVQAECLDCGWDGKLDADKPLECPACRSKNLDLTRKNYIKRLVGLPGETLLLRNGDVFVQKKGETKFELARKPPGIQQRLWIPAFDSSFVPRERILPRWDYRDRRDLWREHEDGGLTCDAREAQGGVLVHFARPIRDIYPYNGTQSARRSAGSIIGAGKPHLVGDLLLQLEFSAPATAQDRNPGMVMRLGKDAHDFELFLPLNGGQALLSHNKEAVGRTDLSPWKPNERMRVSLANYDDRIEVRLNGKILLNHEFTSNPAPQRPRQMVSFGARAAKCRFHRIRILRDIYYISRNAESAAVRYEMDDNSYMVLGDNSPASSDSRAWPDPRVPAENLMGEAFAVFWPIHDINLLSIGSEPTREGNVQNESVLW